MNGWTAPQEEVVVVDKHLEPAHATKTLAHKLGHIRANHAGRFRDYGADRRCRGAAEVEAESIGYIVTSYLGMNPADFSVPYVAGWTDDLDVLRNIAVTASQWILSELDRGPSRVDDGQRVPTARGPTVTARWELGLR